VRPAAAACVFGAMVGSAEKAAFVQLTLSNGQGLNEEPLPAICWYLILHGEMEFISLPSPTNLLTKQLES